MNTRKILFTITVVLLVIAFGVSAFLVGNYIVESKAEKDRADQLASMVTQGQQTTVPTQKPTTTAAPEETTQGTTVPTEPTILEKYQDIYNTNNDMVGWIQIEGTKINYPVVQTPDNPNYYLKRNFDGNKSEWGAIYAWEEADINEPSDNVTLFGHHMADGSMFAALAAYTNKSAWENNPMIFFNTLYKEHTYQIFAVFKTSANVGEGFSYHKFVDADNEKEFNDFVKTCKDLSFYDTGITPVYGDKLLCLSTCEYTLDNGRLVVAAVRIA